MGCESRKRLIATLALLLTACVGLSAQNTEQTDSLVRLLKAKSLELIEKNGLKLRKATEATFLHNNTYLICDTALWNVDEKIINCFGNVRLMQEETILTSDKLDYLIDDNLAQFRGTLVQLENKKANTLRTKNLDYCTRDSTAVFRGGASMRDEDGQIIESLEGTYVSAGKLFTFTRNVNMFTDSVFVKTTELKYDGENSRADFTHYIDFWKDGNMLSAGGGWYERNKELFFFRDNVHGLTTDQECWSDSLYYYKSVNNVLMQGHAQVQDTTRNVTGMGDRIFYEDSLSQISLRIRAAIAVRTEENDKVDTLYCGADTLIYRTIKRCDVDSSVVASSEARLKEINADAVTAFRRRAAEEAAAAAKRAKDEEEAAMGNKKSASKISPGSSGKVSAGEEKSKSGAGKEINGVQELSEKAVPVAPDIPIDPEPETPETPPQTPPAEAEAAAEPEETSPAENASAPEGEAAVGTEETPPSGNEPAPEGEGGVDVAGPEATEVERDTTKIGFFQGIGNVKIFRKDMQIVCDSLRYNDLDSIARLYKDPIVWNEVVRQYRSDSLFVLIKGGHAERASLMSNAFIVTKETDFYFDQIRGTDVMVFFDEESQLKRFDALGGVNALFYLEENDEIATVNKVEAKMMSATLVDGEIDRVYYFDSPKNDAYPVVQLPDADHRIKGYTWVPDRRPASKDDITTLKMRASERTRYEARPKATFHQTDLYFPGYMDKVYRDIDSSRVRRSRPRPQPQPTDTLSIARPDSLANVGDTLNLTPPEPEMVLPDSLANKTVAPDSLSTKTELPDSTLSSRPATKQELRETARALRIAERDARWAEKDAKDAAKAAKKKEKALQKKREKTRREYLRKLKREAKENEVLKKYIDKYTKQKRKDDEQKKEQQPVGGDPVLGVDGHIDGGDILSGGSLPRPEGGAGL